ncbi:endonuclease 1-like [Hibiscus syriacus]|uniref:endonuclease 1-like n=1 Tax=Hibiscus syriacus TaxID=106335 RepID=UPI0019241B95|nr:endonuclease 1-like [Hibiscus syriacus]
MYIYPIIVTFIQGIWYDDVASWEQCDDLLPCLNKYATESINLACKWGYKGLKSGQTLAEEYIDTRMPIVMKRIAQGVRLAMILNKVFGGSEEGFATAT